MKTRKRRAALKRTAMSGFCRKKKMEVAQNARFEALSFGMREDIPNTPVQAACYLSICMTRGFIYVENTHAPEIFTHVKTSFLRRKPNT